MYSVRLGPKALIIRGLVQPCTYYISYWSGNSNRVLSGNSLRLVIACFFRFYFLFFPFSRLFAFLVRVRKPFFCFSFLFFGCNQHTEKIFLVLAVFHKVRDGNMPQVVGAVPLRTGAGAHAFRFFIWVPLGAFLLSFGCHGLPYADVRSISSK